MLSLFFAKFRLQPLQPPQLYGALTTLGAMDTNCTVCRFLLRAPQSVSRYTPASGSDWRLLCASGSDFFPSRLDQPSVRPSTEEDLIRQIRCRYHPATAQRQHEASQSRKEHPREAAGVDTITHELRCPPCSVRCTSRRLLFHAYTRRRRRRQGRQAKLSAGELDITVGGA